MNYIDKYNRLKTTLYCRGLFCDKKENCLRFALNRNAIYPDNPANSLCGDWNGEDYKFFEPIPTVDTRDKNITFSGHFCENGLIARLYSTIDNEEHSSGEFVYTKTEEFCKDMTFNILFHLDQMCYSLFERNRKGNFTIDIKIKNIADNLIKD